MCIPQTMSEKVCVPMNEYLSNWFLTITVNSAHESYKIQNAVALLYNGWLKHGESLCCVATHLALSHLFTIYVIPENKLKEYDIHKGKQRHLSELYMLLL